MRPLTYAESEVLDEVRRLAQTGAVPRGEVWKACQETVGGMVDRALRDLVDLGLLTKPARGFYLPASTESEES